MSNFAGHCQPSPAVAARCRLLNTALKFGARHRGALLRVAAQGRQLPPVAARRRPLLPAVARSPLLFFLPAVRRLLPITRRLPSGVRRLSLCRFFLGGEANSGHDGDHSGVAHLPDGDAFLKVNGHGPVDMCACTIHCVYLTNARLSLPIVLVEAMGKQNKFIA